MCVVTYMLVQIRENQLGSPTRWGPLNLDQLKCVLQITDVTRKNWMVTKLLDFSWTIVVVRSSRTLFHVP